MPILLRSVKLNKDEKKKYPNFKGIILIVYSDVYFDLFFTRHCTRNHKIPEFTVVVLGEYEFPSKKDFKKLFEDLVISKKFPLQLGTVFPLLPMPYYARNWSRIQNNFLDDAPKEGRLRIEECKKVSYADLEKQKNQGTVTQTEIEFIRDIRKSAEKNKLIIKAVWFIGHIDVIRSR